MRQLHISKDLALPLDAVTQKLFFTGRTGSGKTYGAMKMAEEMLDAGAQVVALDPVGVWYGLRLASDGRAPGISIPVFGGLHGDIPLEPASGKLMADLVVDRGISAVLDVSQFESDAEKAKFVGDFMARFFFRKKASPSAVHLYFEECQEFVPQNPQRGEEQMLHAGQRLIRLGRNFGIGATLISQRPQDVNKKALNQAECVFAFQLTGPQERKAVDGWLSEKGVDLDLAADLPKLAVGQAHVWSPAWLRISHVVKIGKKRTFNASATPEVGKKAAVRELAPVDLEQIRIAMKDVVVRAEQEDPKALRRRIAELEKQVKAPAAAKPDSKWIVREKALREDLADALTLAESLRKLWREARGRLQRISKEAAMEVSAEPDLKKPARKGEPTAIMPPPGPFIRPRPVELAVRLGDPSVSPGQQRIIDTIGMLNTRGLPVTRESIARWMGIHPNGGRYNKDLASLRAAGKLDGFKLAVAPGDVQTGVEGLLSALRDDSMRRVMSEILNAGQSLTREELAARLGIHPNGGRYNRTLAWLRDMGVIPERGDISAVEGVHR